MRLLLLPLLVVLSSPSIFAQDLTSQGLMTPDKLLPPARLQEEMGQGRADQRANYREAVTTPAPIVSSYVLPYWTRGMLQPYAGSGSRPWLKYDAVYNQLLERSASGNPEVVDLSKLKEFALGDSLLGTRRTYRRYLDVRMENPTLRLAFFEVRYDAGRVALLCRRTLRESAPNTRGKSGNISARTQEILSYFIRNTANDLVPVMLAPEPVLTALGATQAAAMTAYIKKRRLKLTQEADVVELLTYYDTL
jgi:hypothetical protein